MFTTSNALSVIDLRCRKATVQTSFWLYGCTTAKACESDNFSKQVGRIKLAQAPQFGLAQDRNLANADIGNPVFA